MAWLAVDADGSEYVYRNCPNRLTDTWMEDEDLVELPKGAIKRLTGKDLTWNDEPIEVK